MRFVCDSCRAQYMISDDKVGAKGVKVRCKKCGHVITVRPAGAAAPREELAETVQSPVAPLPAAADRTPPGGMPVTTGTPPEGGLFGGGVEDDEIGAVFDSVLNSGPHRMPAQAAPSEEDVESTRVMDLDAARRLQEAAAAAGEDPAQHDWFVAIDEKQVGPLTLERVKDHWERGEVGADSLCWRAGFADWLPLSDVAELASVLAPRPAKPVIVAPAAMAPPAGVVSVPVESAFNAGGVAKSVRSEVPVLTGASAPAEEPGGWKPSAASMLASLVREENEALAKPPPRAPATPARPVLQPSAPGLLDLSTAETSPHIPVAPPVLDDAASYASRALPTLPLPPVYPTYVPPPPARAGNRKLVLAAALGALVVVGAAGGLYAALRPAAPAPAPVAEAPRPVAPPVAAAAVVPAPAPAAAAPAPAPAVTPPAASAPATTVAAAPQPPAPAASAPLAQAESVAPQRRERPVRTAARTEPTPPPAPRVEQPRASTRTASASTPNGDDDFDELFETKKPKKEPEAQAPSRRGSTYVPPAPGSGDTLERLGQSDIVAVVLANKPALGKCREEHLKRHPDLTGRMVMRWTIQTSGRTSGVAVQSDEFKGSYAATCFSGLIKSWSFPRHRVQGEPIDFPFTL